MFFYNVPLSPVIKPKIANVSRETLEYIFEIRIYKKYVFRKMSGKITRIYCEKDLFSATFFDNISMCNKYIVTWSDSEESSHIDPCLCALF